MSSIVGETSFRKQTPFARTLFQQRATWLPVMLVLAVAVLARHFIAANTDVSWLITLAERVLDGQRLYVDFIEVNPPASIYLYLPGVMIARAAGLSPELVTNGLVFIAICGSVWIAGRVLFEARLLETPDKAKLIASVAVILAVLPAQIFGEREHIAVILFLPMLAVATVRAKGGTPAFRSMLAAGLGAGAMMVIKPQLALGLAPALVVAACSARSRAVLFVPENWLALAVVAAYGAVVGIAFPEFLTDTVPLVRAVYLPLRNTLPQLIIGFQAVPIWILTLVAIAILRRGKAPNCLYRILLAGSSGFAVAFIVQGKGWPYHSYPMLALALFGLAFALAEPRAEAPSRLEAGGWALAAGFISAITFCWMNVATTSSDLVAPIRQIKPHPSMLAITQDIAVGHPLVREVGGTWVASVGSMWITTGGLWRKIHQKLTPEDNAQIERYVALDRALLIDAIRRAKPDVIVIQKAPFDWEAWARADPEIADLLKAYSEAITMNEMLVLKRSETAPNAGPRGPG